MDSVDVHGEPFEGNAEWQAYLDSVLPTDEDERIFAKNIDTRVDPIPRVEG